MHQRSQGREFTGSRLLCKAIYLSEISAKARHGWNKKVGLRFSWQQGVDAGEGAGGGPWPGSCIKSSWSDLWVQEIRALQDQKTDAEKDRMLRVRRR